MRHRILGFPVVLSALLLALPVQAHEAGQWVYRVGIGTVQPDDSIQLVNVVPFPGASSTDVEVDGATSATFNLTYFFTRNLAFDVLAAMPFDHDIVLNVDGAGVKIGETNHLPPTLSLQYHFAPEGDLRPYIGVGANWTTFFNTDTVEAVQDLGYRINDLDDSFGWAAQLGADFLIGEDWLINADLRYINIETDATLTLPGIGVATAPVTIDPMVLSLSFGYRF